MIVRRLREWGELPISDKADVPGAISRRQADQLLFVASKAARLLGNGDGEVILADVGKALKAGQVVGVIAAPDITLEILPKIDGCDEGVTRKNLVRMLARVFELPIADGAMARLDWQMHDLLELLVRLFCDQVFEAVRRGLPRRYVEYSEDLPALRGRLNVVRQFSTLAASPQKLACRYEELSRDIALNQIIKAAVVRLRRTARTLETQRRLAELEFAFADVSDVGPDRLPWHRVVLDRTNSAWTGLLEMAKLLLGGRFQTTSAGKGLGFSLLFEMNTLFEEYVGRIAEATWSSEAHRVMRQGPRKYALIDQKSNKPTFMTKPDITVRHVGTSHPSPSYAWIADTKWKQLKTSSLDRKNGVGQADIYQMMAYASVYACPRIMLLYPHTHDLGVQEGVISRYSVGERGDVWIIVATLNLATFETMTNQVRALANDLDDVLCSPAVNASVIKSIQISLE